MAISTLYICYFGVREPLVQTQVIPYLRQLAAAGIVVHLLTFEPSVREKGNNDRLVHQREQLALQHITWSYLPYHKSPSLIATFYDISAGARFAVKLARRAGINIFHARAHVPMAMALWASRFVSARIVFDIRGLMAEEYADAGIWKERSLPFRLVKRLERAGIRRADQIVVLTQRLRTWLIARNLKSPDQIEVIPCCVDFTRFDEGQKDASETNGMFADQGSFEVVYAGSTMGLYLVEEMGRFFKEIKAKRPNAFLRVLSISPPALGTEALKRAGLDETDFKIEAVAPDDVPGHLRRARLGLSFRQPSFAQMAASPTKIPEYLAAGLPVVCNAGIGDMDELIERERVGVVLREFNEAAYKEAASQAVRLAQDASVRSRCLSVARANFDLTAVGGQRYVNVYRRLSDEQGSTKLTL